MRAETGLPASTVARILKSLLEENLIQRQGDQYSIGLRVMAWSAAATAGSDLIRAGEPALLALRDVSRETCILYVRQAAFRVAVLIAHSEQAIIYQGWLGQILPLGGGAAGKVFMAFDPDALEAARVQGFKAFTANTITDKRALDDELVRVRANGWAYSPQERVIGLSSLAAPVVNSRGVTVAAVAIGAPSFRLGDEDARALVAPLKECVQRISGQLP